MTSLRSLIFMAYLYGVTSILAIGATPLLAVPSFQVGTVVRLWANALLDGLRTICGTRYELRGLENIPDTPVLIASKHQAMWETVSLFSAIDNPAFVLKKELIAIPFYGWIAKAYGAIAIDRSAHASALRKLVKDAKNAVADGRHVIIFPEGTRTRIGEKIEYKPGVAALYKQLDIPCVPVALNSGIYWPRGSAKRAGTIVMEFLPPIPPGLKRDQFMTALETAIENNSNRLCNDGLRALGLPELPETSYTPVRPRQNSAV